MTDAINSSSAIELSRSLDALQKGSNYDQNTILQALKALPADDFTFSLRVQCAQAVQQIYASKKTEERYNLVKNWLQELSKYKLAVGQQANLLAWLRLIFATNFEDVNCFASEAVTTCCSIVHATQTQVLLLESFGVLNTIVRQHYKLFGVSHKQIQKLLSRGLNSSFLSVKFEALRLIDALTKLPQRDLIRHEFAEKRILKTCLSCSNSRILQYCAKSLKSVLESRADLDLLAKLAALVEILQRNIRSEVAVITLIAAIHELLMNMPPCTLANIAPDVFQLLANFLKSLGQKNINLWLIYRIRVCLNASLRVSLGYAMHESADLIYTAQILDILSTNLDNNVFKLCCVELEREFYRLGAATCKLNVFAKLEDAIQNISLRNLGSVIHLIQIYLENNPKSIVKFTKKFKLWIGSALDANFILQRYEVFKYAAILPIAWKFLSFEYSGIFLQAFNFATNSIKHFDYSSESSTSFIEISWCILSSLLSIGPELASFHLPLIMILWRNVLQSEIKEEIEPAKQAFAWRMLLTSKKRALQSIIVFLMHSKSLLTKNSLQRLYTLVTIALDQLNDGELLKNLSKSEVKSTEDEFSHLVQDIVSLLASDTDVEFLNCKIESRSLSLLSNYSINLDYTDLFDSIFEPFKAQDGFSGSLVSKRRRNAGLDANCKEWDFAAFDISDEPRQDNFINKVIDIFSLFKSNDRKLYNGRSELLDSCLCFLGTNLFFKSVNEQLETWNSLKSLATIKSTRSSAAPINLMIIIYFYLSQFSRQQREFSPIIFENIYKILMIQSTDVLTQELTARNLALLSKYTNKILLIDIVSAIANDSNAERRRGYLSSLKQCISIGLPSEDLNTISYHIIQLIVDPSPIVQRAAFNCFISITQKTSQSPALLANQIIEVINNFLVEVLPTAGNEKQYTFPDQEDVIDAILSVIESLCNSLGPEIYSSVELETRLVLIIKRSSYNLDSSDGLFLAKILSINECMASFSKDSKKVQTVCEDLYSRVLCSNPIVRVNSVRLLQHLAQQHFNLVFQYIIKKDRGEKLWYYFDRNNTDQNMISALNLWSDYFLETSQNQISILINICRSGNWLKIDSNANKLDDFLQEESTNFTQESQNTEDSTFRWQSKLLAMKLQSQIIQRTFLSGKDFESVRDFSNYLQDIINCCVNASTLEDNEKLSIASLSLMRQIIKAFADLRDAEVPEMPVLEQFEVQIASMVSLGFQSDARLRIAILSADVCGDYISLVRLHNLSKKNRVLKYLLAALESQKLFFESDSGEAKYMLTKLCVLSAWAKLCVIQNQNDDIDQILKPIESQLIVSWSEAIKHFAKLKFDVSNTSEGNKYSLINETTYLNRRLLLDAYSHTWLSIARALSWNMDNNPEHLQELLCGSRDFQDEYVKETYSFFFVFFGLCFHYLLLWQNEDTLEERIILLQSIKSLVNPSFLKSTIYDKNVFEEITQSLGRIAITDSLPVQKLILEIIETLARNHPSLDDNNEQVLTLVYLVMFTIKSTCEGLLKCKETKSKDNLVTLLFSSIHCFASVVVKLTNEVKLDLSQKTLEFFKIVISHIVMPESLVRYALEHSREFFKLDIYSGSEFKSLEMINQILHKFLTDELPETSETSTLTYLIYSGVYIFISAHKFVRSTSKHFEEFIKLLLAAIFRQGDSGVPLMSIKGIKCILDEANNNLSWAKRLIFERLADNAVKAQGHVFFGAVLQVFCDLLRSQATLLQKEKRINFLQIAIPLLLIIHSKYTALVDQIEIEQCLKDLANLDEDSFSQFFNCLSDDLKEVCTLKYQKLVKADEKATIVLQHEF